jgi:hypothetical protein
LPQEKEGKQKILKEMESATDRDANKKAPSGVSDEAKKTTTKRARQFGDIDLLVAQIIEGRQSEQEAANFSRISLRNEAKLVAEESATKGAKKEKERQGTDHGAVGGRDQV